MVHGIPSPPKIFFDKKRRVMMDRPPVSYFSDSFHTDSKHTINEVSGLSMTLCNASQQSQSGFDTILSHAVMRPDGWLLTYLEGPEAHI